MKRRKDLSTKLSSLTRRPVSPEARELHLASIDSAIREASVAPQRGAGRGRKRAATLVMVAALAGLPAGVAFAAEGALPGDALYPVKRVTETLRSFVDSDLVAENRVEELEVLIASDSSDHRIPDHVDRARDEVARLDPDHQLHPRLAAAEAGVADIRPEPSGGGAIADDTPVTTGPSDQVTTTTTPPETTILAGGTTTTTNKPVETTTTRPTDQTTTTTTATTSTTVSDTTVTDTRRVRGRVRAGPTCPVETHPPNPDCEDQVVAGAMLRFYDEDGEQVAVVESNGEGRFTLRLLPGKYLVEPQPDDRYLGTAPSEEFVLGEENVFLDIRYDTGIR